MKKHSVLFKTLAGIFCGFLLASCTGNVNTYSTEVEPGTIGTPDPALVAANKVIKAQNISDDDVVIFYYRPDGDYSSWGCWLWVGSGEGEPVYNATIGKASTATQDGIKIGYWNISALNNSTVNAEIADNGSLGLIIRNAGWTKDPGNDQKLEISTGKKFMILSGDTSVYTVSDEMSPAITSAVSLTSTKIKASLSVSLGLETFADSNGFVLTADDGTTIPVIDVINFDSQSSRYKNNARTIILTLDSPLGNDKNYKLSREGFLPENGLPIVNMGAVKAAATYDEDDLGLSINGNAGTFKIWAPVASEVKLLVYSSVEDIGSFNSKSVEAKAVGSTTDASLYGTPAVDPIAMTKDSSTGTWSVTVDNISTYKYYKYQVVNSGTTYYICDIYAKAGSGDSVAAQITDINSDANAIPSSTTDTEWGTKAGYYNPFGNSGNTAKAYTDAVIYEMHITDWSYAEDNTSGNVGKYLTIANGTKVIEHIKSMGVTHVQILPVFDFAETNANTNYNWGYNPYHYNLPEGRYVTTDYTDGTQAVLELRTLISKLHEAGIAVIMDVVYNHTNGTQTGSLYDSQVPFYFYRYTENGEYSNGSGCGNEVDTEAPMAKKYVIDSLKHWMLDYHFNGFRFDLMGCISKETMSDIYNALHEIDSNVLVYGEPWTGGTCLVENGATQAVSTSTGYGAGAFDDDFRDAIKGAEFGGFAQGQVQGSYNDNGIITGLLGKTGKNKRNETGKLSLGLHYVECHDNYTLFDKLALSYYMRKNGTTSTVTGDLFSKIGAEGLVEVKAENKLAAAYVLLSQGTAFMNGGQEFLRTKRGNENSYKSTKTINGINLDFATTYSDVCNTYKGLIALRKTYPGTFGSNSSASASTVSNGVTKYTTGDFLVYFNATSAEATIDTTGYTKVVDVTSGTPSESTTLPANVGAKNFVILKK